jgi:hypothetical protein
MENFINSAIRRKPPPILWRLQNNCDPDMEMR